MMKHLKIFLNSFENGVNFTANDFVFTKRSSEQKITSVTER